MIIPGGVTVYGRRGCIVGFINGLPAY